MAIRNWPGGGFGAGARGRKFLYATTTTTTTDYIVTTDLLYGRLPALALARPVALTAHMRYSRTHARTGGGHLVKQMFAETVIYIITIYIYIVSIHHSQVATIVIIIVIIAARRGTGCCCGGNAPARRMIWIIGGGGKRKRKKISLALSVRYAYIIIRAQSFTRQNIYLTLTRGNPRVSNC